MQWPATTTNYCQRSFLYTWFQWRRPKSVIKGYPYESKSLCCNYILSFRFRYAPMPHQRETRIVPHPEFAIKPASHTTERHSTNCLLVSHNQDRSTYYTPCQRDDSHKHQYHSNAYSGFNDEMRVAVAQPSKMHNEVAEFETWRTKIDEVCL